MNRKNKQHQDWTDIDEGWLYGEWETGPWHGFHTKEKEFGAYGWVTTLSFIRAKKQFNVNEEQGKNENALGI